MHFYRKTIIFTIYFVLRVFSSLSSVRHETDVKNFTSVSRREKRQNLQFQHRETHQKTSTSVSLQESFGKRR